MELKPNKTKDEGTIFRVAGPVVTATGIDPKMYDVIFVGDEGLLGEVLKIERERTIIQVYEDTSNIKPGEKVVNTGHPLTVELGPGLISSIYDGIQRPLPVLQESMGDYIKRGSKVPGVNKEKMWEFTPSLNVGSKISPGMILGTVPETDTLEHRVLVPHDVAKDSIIASIEKGKFRVEDTICTLESGQQISMLQRWPVRKPRPVVKRLPPVLPLVTGQRILDGLFPLAKGGTAAIPGGFGTGKTVIQHQLAKWADAKLIIYIGCGERGNEMAEVLKEFPELIDPHTNRPLMQRTVLIANTSNMPVAAREASVYTGITIAEYFRDMGYDVALMADSTSRWAEAMREISSRLEEMPGEEGYPAYIASRLSQFYERAGRVETLNGDDGSITVIGAVSPPGGDFSEPVTQNTLRIVKVFWALDTKLAHKRHFPAINWLQSYSLYTDTLEDWFRKNVGQDWPELRAWAMDVLQEEASLQDIVQLVGSDSLPEDQRLTLEIARMIRENFLQQHAYHEVDSFCEPAKQYKLLQGIRSFSDMAVKAISREVLLTDIISIEAKTMLSKVKYHSDFDGQMVIIDELMALEFSNLGVGA